MAEFTIDCKHVLVKNYVISKKVNVALPHCCEVFWPAMASSVLGHH